jgi:hypothetical protein
VCARGTSVAERQSGRAVVEIARSVRAWIVVAAACAALLIGWFGTAMKDTSTIVHEAVVSNFRLESPGVRNDKDCGDFERLEDAQAFFEAHRSHTDPHELDADNDRRACEDFDY